MYSKIYKYIKKQNNLYFKIEGVLVTIYKASKMYEIIKDGLKSALSESARAFRNLNIHEI